jgi:DNA-binding NtrC family response regulator
MMPTTLQVSPGIPVATQTGILFLACVSRDRATVGERLGRMGLDVTRVVEVGEALRQLRNRTFSLCLVDLANDRTAVSAIRAIRAQHRHLPVAGIIDPTQPIVAADAIHAGVFELLPWPFEQRDVTALVANARDRHGVDGTEQPPAVHVAGSAFFANSPSMRLVLDLVRSTADGRGGVIISGEPGTGRKLVARSIHRLGPQPDGPFVPVDCTRHAVADLEQELFGVSERPVPASRRAAERITVASAVYRARGGSLLLATIADAPARLQAKLARLMRDGEAALSDKRTIVDLDVRLMATVEGDLEAAVADGRLREDLYERLSQIRIEVPPLRRRREDIPLLAMHFLCELSEAQQTALPQLSRSAIALLSALPWPGNARELKALLDRLIRAVPRPVIELEDVLEHVRLDGLVTRIDAEGTLRAARARFERDWISAVLLKHHGRVEDAARALGIQRTNLYRKVRQLNVARSLLAPRKSR